ncbi:uncharacterized protein [Drosophila kikkawai]|uniref:Transcription factor Adf-1 n=1 Tax=Drosophila kikkawai TaxID=30033 RepID=A0A6P4IJJ7_DROKI|nr:uncharacterized protein LOC108075152 [Drosophila kikkawai]
MNTRKKTKSYAQPPKAFTANANICRLVSQYPCLYDRLDANYLKATVVQNVWEKIGKQMNMRAKTCQQRWCNLRTSYARSIRKPSGASTYYLNKELQFLRNYITPGVPVPPKGRRTRVSSQEEQQDQTDENQKPLLRHAQSRNTNGPEDADTSSEEDSENCMAGKRLPLSKNNKENVQPNFDAAFLQGLLPEIERMNFNQKLHFKRRVYDLLGEIFAPEMATSYVRSQVANEIVSVSSSPVKLEP